MSEGRSSRPLPSLRFRRLRALGLLLALIAVVIGGIHLVRVVADPLVRNAAVPGPTAGPTELSPADSLAATLAQSNGHLSLAVSDLSTGATAQYGNADAAFATASIVKVNIVAALLWQRDGELTKRQRALAGQMIGSSSNAAASALWREIGKAKGLQRANERFGLTETVGGRAGYWGSTTTSATDQLQLLRVIFTDQSPLDAASRRYLAGLMGQVADDQDWGITAADTRTGDLFQVKNGWLPRSSGWVVNSIGSVEHEGHPLLIVALSDRARSKESGVKLVERAAREAARVVTGS